MSSRSGKAGCSGCKLFYSIHLLTLLTVCKNCIDVEQFAVNLRVVIRPYGRPMQIADGPTSHIDQRDRIVLYTELDDYCDTVN